MRWRAVARTSSTSGSRGSLAELSTQRELAVDLPMIPQHPDVLGLLEETDRVLQGLIRAVRNSKPRAIK